MSTCKELVDKYVKETGKTLPLKSDTIENKQNWLYTNQWGCIPPGKTMNDFTTDKEECGKYYDKITSKLSDHLPIYNTLKEDGFMNWVNERGLKCVRKVTGQFFGNNPETGKLNMPSKDQKFPEAFCAVPCYKTTKDSKECFDCIEQVLSKNPDMCPEVGNDITLLKNAVICQDCVGDQLRDTQESTLNEVWVCLTSKLKQPLTVLDVTIIIVSSVILFIMILGLILWYTVFKPKILKDEQIQKYKEKFPDDDD